MTVDTANRGRALASRHFNWIGHLRLNLLILECIEDCVGYSCVDKLLIAGYLCQLKVIVVTSEEVLD